MPVLVLPNWAWQAIVAHCLDGLPYEACGLVAGSPRAEGQDVVKHVFPTANEARSARLYTVPPTDLLRADRSAEASGNTLMGVWHSHTHTPAYPSPTDVAQAPDPQWHYLLVSLSDLEPVLRSYRIVGGKVEEEAVTSSF